ncbi:MAG TPA: M23 family metallopeptidase, partial [Turneriella sp.]|nr:M23 family metallopeptidase [Turneriella sp.]
MRIIDKLLLGIAALSIMLMVTIFFSDDSTLAAKNTISNKNQDKIREYPVSLNNTIYRDHDDLKSADMDVAMEEYLDDLRAHPEKREEELRLIDDLSPEDAGILPPLNGTSGNNNSLQPTSNEKDTAPKIQKNNDGRVQIIQHKVKSGESIWRLAQRYNVPVQTIVNANKIKEKSIIQPGDTLRIPDRAGIFHTIKKQESLKQIAKKYKINPDKIKKANGLTSTLLAKGDEIFLPGAKPLPEIRYVQQKVFAWPIKAKYRLTSPFGWRVHPITHHKAFHSGIDIGAMMKTPIHAAADGVVAFAGNAGSYGNMVLLRHKNGLFTVYGHASKLIAKKGQFIKRGQKIALVGSTGASTGPHLHFEVKSTEKHLSPFKALKKME